MQYLPKVKFHAAVAANGDITPGAAFSGFKTSTLDTADFGVFHILIENTAATLWELWRYDATAASGSRRVIMKTSDAYDGSVLTLPAADLTCSFVAPPQGYVLNTHQSLGGIPPLVKSKDCVGVGAGADVGTGSQDSIAISGTVRDGSPRSVVCGGWAGAPETTSLGFEATAENYSDPSTYDPISVAGSVAVGYRAKTMAAGEVALGSMDMSHMSGIPVRTDDPSAGGTFMFKAVAGYDGTASQFVLADITTNLGPINNEPGSAWIVHIQGIIVANADNAANNKIVKVEWVTGGTLTQTVLTNGANNISLGLALSGMRLTATVSAVAGLRLNGYLHVTKIDQ